MNKGYDGMFMEIQSLWDDVEKLSFSIGTACVITLVGFVLV